MLQPIDSSSIVRTRQSISVVLADDDPPIRHIVRRFLQSASDIEVLGETATGTEALGLMHTRHPDVLILDHRLPDMSAIDVIGQLQSSARVLIYTGYGSPQLAHLLLQSGASGFMVKTDSGSNLAHAVRQVAHGQTYISPCVANSLAITQTEGHTRGVPNESISKRDFDVVRLLAEGMSNPEIAARLGMGERTVRQHVERICGVVGLRDRCAAIAWAAANGFGWPKIG